MANMRLKMGEYEAWIVVESQEVEHCGIEINEESKVATCWIESCVGKHFGVRAMKHHENFDCACEVLLDGSSVAARYLSRLSTATASVDDTIIGESSAQPFLFGMLQLTDEETSSATSYENLGEIIVKFFRVSDVQPLRLVQPSDAFVTKIDKVHERAKKAVTHRAMFGQAVQLNKRTIRSSKFVEQMGTFIFRYRSFDMLKANGIVPRDCPLRTTLEPRTRDSPGSSQATGSACSVLGKRKTQVKEEEEDSEGEGEGEPDTLDEEDKRKVAELEAELERVKKASLARQQRRAKKRVKPEPKPIFLRGEVIDLTID